MSESTTQCSRLFRISSQIYVRKESCIWLWQDNWNNRKSEFNKIFITMTLVKLCWHSSRARNSFLLYVLETQHYFRFFRSLSPKLNWNCPSNMKEKEISIINHVVFSVRNVLTPRFVETRLRTDCSGDQSEFSCSSFIAVWVMIISSFWEVFYSPRQL